MVALDLLMVIVAALLFGAGMGATKVRAPKRLIVACYASSGLVLVLAALTIRIPLPQPVMLVLRPPADAGHPTPTVSALPNRW